MSPYVHTQAGTWSRVTFGASFLLILAAALYLAPGDSKAAWIIGSMSVLMLVGLLLFHSLTTEVLRGSLRIRFGIGVIRRQFRVKDIESAEVVRNRWWYGWGIRLTPHGWMFNVSGLDAVQIKLRNGRQYRVGTDEPEALVAALHSAMPRR